jgi:excisionase family DNA binding protein
MRTTDASEERLLLTVEAAAERLNIGRTMMFALIKDGEVESVQIGRLRRVPATALDDFVDRLRREPVQLHSARAA